MSQYTNDGVERAGQWLKLRKHEYPSVLDYGFDLIQVAQLADEYARLRVREALEECLNFAQEPGAYHSIRNRFAALLESKP